MMRRLSVLAFLAVGLVTLVSPPASSKRYVGRGCTQTEPCRIWCCDSRGVCIEFWETGCP